MAPHSSALAWKIPWTEEHGGLQSMGLQRVGHDLVTSLSLFTFIHWRRKWQPTPVFLPEESQDRGAWWAAVYVVAQSRTRLKRLSSSSSSSSRSISQHKQKSPHCGPGSPHRNQPLGLSPFEVTFGRPIIPPRLPPKPPPIPNSYTPLWQQNPAVPSGNMSTTTCILLTPKPPCPLYKLETWSLCLKIPRVT